MIAIGRRKLVVGAGALALAGCGAGGGAVAQTPDDVVIGAAGAPATLIEYGSTMCGHCAAFHEASWEVLKSEYIDTGKVRFIFREVLAPASPEIVPVITLAEYQVARCGNATPAQYFDRTSLFFEQQHAVQQAGSMEGVRAKLVEIGAIAGLSQDQVMECVSDPAGGERMGRLQEVANRDNVEGTPMFYLNGVHVDTASLMTPEDLRRALDAAAGG